MDSEISQPYLKNTRPFKRIGILVPGYILHYEKQVLLPMLDYLLLIIILFSSISGFFGFLALSYLQRKRIKRIVWSWIALSLIFLTAAIAIATGEVQNSFLIPFFASSLYLLYCLFQKIQKSGLCRVLLLALGIFALYTAMSSDLFFHLVIASIFFLFVFHNTPDDLPRGVAPIAYLFMNWVSLHTILVFKTVSENHHWQYFLPAWARVLVLTGLYIPLILYLLMPIRIIAVVQTRLRTRIPPIIAFLAAAVVAHRVIDSSVYARTQSLPETTELHLAARENDADKVLSLLQQGVNIDILNHDFATPLHEAAQYGSLDAERILLEHGAKVDPRLKGDWEDGHSQELTPLFVTFWEHPEAAYLLLEYGANPNIQTRGRISGLNALGYLLYCHQQYEAYDLVKTLIEHGAEVNSDGWTSPLHMAMQQDDLRIIKILLENGADPSRLDSEGFPPLFFADTEEKARLLKEYIQRKKPIDE